MVSHTEFRYQPLHMHAEQQIEVTLIRHVADNSSLASFACHHCCCVAVVSYWYALDK